MRSTLPLDAVGSDKAPEPEIQGAILACQSLPVRVHVDWAGRRSCAICWTSTWTRRFAYCHPSCLGAHRPMERRRAGVQEQKGQLNARRPENWYTIRKCAGPCVTAAYGRGDGHRLKGVLGRCRPGGVDRLRLRLRCPSLDRKSLRAAGRRRQRRLQAPQP